MKALDNPDVRAGSNANVEGIGRAMAHDPEDR
jgi:hypothetical protein